MKIAISGIHKEKLARYIEKKYPEFKVVKSNPDVVISYGGDGTLLFSEREFPGAPKALIRNSQICNKCAKRSKDDVLQLLLAKKFTITEEMKLEARVKKNKIIALNDILLIHEHYNKALRFKIYLDNKEHSFQLSGFIVNIDDYNPFKTTLDEAFNKFSEKLKKIIIENPNYEWENNPFSIGPQSKNLSNNYFKK